MSEMQNIKVKSQTSMVWPPDKPEHGCFYIRIDSDPYGQPNWTYRWTIWSSKEGGDWAETSPIAFRNVSDAVADAFERIKTWGPVRPPKMTLAERLRHRNEMLEAEISINAMTLSQMRGRR